MPTSCHAWSRPCAVTSRRLTLLTACRATGLAPPLTAADVMGVLTSAGSGQNRSGEMQSVATAPLQLVQCMGIAIVDAWMGMRKGMDGWD